MPCRFNKRRIWTHRLLLEQKCHERSSFVTLTYEEEKLPKDGSLCPEHLRDWLKRLRSRGRKVRYFAVGEYGDATWRPHYHAALFGLGCDKGPIIGGRCMCRGCCDVRESWGFGHIFIGDLSEQSARYIAGYVTKKMTFRGDPRLLGREPEFSRMSRRPGIGVNAMWDVSSVVMQYSLTERMKDVPRVLRHGEKLYPLGRFLRGKIKEQIGEKELRSVIPEAAELPVVRKFAWDNSLSVAEVYAIVNEGVEDRLRAKIERKRHEAL